MKVPVSILIPIKNEAANLPRCLAAVASWADEIFVVDSHSTDGSQSICEQAGASVVQFDFNGTWPKKKNWALDHLPFRNEWVFILDADEVLPPGTGAEFADIIAQDGRGHAGYWINRRFMFMGRWLRHAYYPNWNLRLFRHRLGRYEKLVDGATGSGDNEVHEHIIVQGTTGRLKSEMDHYAFPTVDIFVEKHNRYSNWEAALDLQEYLRGADGRPGKTEAAPGRPDAATRLQSPAVRLRRRLKRLARRLPFRPTLRFLYVYLIQGGILDGLPGYYFARLHGFYEFLAVAKAREMKAALKAKP
ncbi:glycosyltransferase family 2 protein [Termitidicoccus mucosus]|uniref:Glycosyltransferase n=1 Tax=Termitidicoccus mucosus TaxID=1184151 RepID=A0A178INC9_9BACT|nr:glycosyltransferase [Opitutaceae bacterium TSB47]